MFIVSSEIIESVYGFGLAGGVVLGVGLLAVRRPVTGIIYGISNRLIPSTYTSEETEYLKLYSTSIADGAVTENERILLISLASAYGIADARAAQLESEHQLQIALKESE